MSRWYDSEDDARREERRAEERRYEMDVWYDVWRSGGNPDRIDPERVSDAYSRGESSDDAVRHELRSQAPKPPPEEEPYWEPCPEQQPPYPDQPIDRRSE